MASAGDGERQNLPASGDAIGMRLVTKDGARIVCAKAADASPVAVAEFKPPDGGTRAWLVVFGAFMCNSILFGIINTYGSIYRTMQEQMTESGDKDASSKAALVGSLTIGTTFLLSTVSGILTDQIGVRHTTLLGGILAAGGLFLSAAFVHNVSALFLTYGVMFGLGAALAYTPSLAILGHYFERYLGLVNGFVTAGSSVSTAVLPFCIDYLIQTYSLQATFAVLGFFALFVIACALIYKPLHAPAAAADPLRSASSASLAASKHHGRAKCVRLLRTLVNVENWRRPRYVIWAVSIPVALIGYFVPYVHTPKMVELNFGKDANVNAPIMCIGIASGVGRLVCGFLADRPSVNRIYLQQLSFVAIGLLTMLIPLTRSYPLLLVIFSLMGIFDGCFISLLGPIAYEICGKSGATQAIGFLLGMCSIPLTVGPPIAGMLYDQTHSYTLSYVLAGIPPLIGTAMMCTMRFVVEPDDEQTSSASGSDDELGRIADAEGKCNGRLNGCADREAEEPLKPRAAWKGIDDHATNGNTNGTAIPIDRNGGPPIPVQLPATNAKPASTEFH